MNAILRQALTIHPQPHPAQVGIAALIPDRARALGCTTFASYCDLIDQEATAHLAPGPLAQTSCARRHRHPKPFFDRSRGIPCLSVPLNRNRTMFAKVDAADWIEMQEMGVNGLWQIANVGGSHLAVYIKMPMREFAQAGALTVARIILGLGRGEQVKFADGDTLNLRRSNLTAALHMTPNATPCRARYDARRVARDATAFRDQLTA